MATLVRTKPLTFDPVDVLLAARAGLDPNDPDEKKRRLGSVEVAQRIGRLPGRRTGAARGKGPVSNRAIERWRAEGLDPWQADRIATALGLAPWSPYLWGETWSDAADEAIDRWLEAHPTEPYDPPPATTNERCSHAR